MPIYKFKITAEKENIFFFTAKSKNDLKHRITSTYGAYPYEVLAIYEDSDEVTLIESYEDDSLKADDSESSKINDIYEKGVNKKLAGDRQDEYIKRYGFTKVAISKKDDLLPLIRQYKKVKVYFENGEKRGQHKLFALYK